MHIVPDEPDDDTLAELTPELLAELDGPLEPWLAELTIDALPDVVVPREAMWAAIQRRRVRPSRRWWPTYSVMVGIAATLLAGIAIGRYAAPRAATPSGEVGAAASNATAGTLSNTLLNVALTEHLVRSEALLTTVRVDNQDHASAPDVSKWASDLLGTTRLLLDDPSLRDAKTRHLLEDLELVLVQVVQARAGSAPLVRNAPAETLRETNLLPRVRAASSASAALLSNSNARGIAE